MKLIILLLCSLQAISVFAEDKNSCSPDQEKFCSQHKNPGEIQACLFQHAKDLAPDCKQAMERIFQARKDASSRSGGALSSFGGPNAMGPALPLFSYEGRSSPGSNAPTLVENKANFSYPIHRDESNTVALSLAGSDLQLSQGLRLDSGTALPEHLYRAELGTQYSHRMAEKRMWGLRSSIGYAGDKPFKNAKDLSFSVSANYGYPSASPGGYWLFMLMASNNSLVNYVPLPGFAYLYRAEHFSGMFGLPASSIQYTPFNPLSLSFSFFLANIQAEISYGHPDKIQAFTGFQWTRASYIPEIRKEDRERLTIAETKLGIGMRKLIWGFMLTELQGGRDLNRIAYRGNGGFHRDQGSLDLGKSWYAKWGIKTLF